MSASPASRCLGTTTSLLMIVHWYNWCFYYSPPSNVCCVLIYYVLLNVLIYNDHSGVLDYDLYRTSQSKQAAEWLSVRTTWSSSTWSSCNQCCRELNLVMLKDRWAFLSCCVGQYRLVIRMVLPNDWIWTLICLGLRGVPRPRPSVGGEKLFGISRYNYYNIFMCVCVCVGIDKRKTDVFRLSMV